ncbi:hypothetical protein Pden_5015 (plasmid) [Paracoccus denitrificans PD1222]|uniref:Uncharacterized protein n=1 Tax=Paracoccus denitrificans (strain Pd 1222) TaxID=318586 RepID=A1BC31_PARDP|nr:hypothetical protein Pden_5015 [Paracoccus denitrificans PD1222]
MRPSRRTQCGRPVRAPVLGQADDGFGGQLVEELPCRKIVKHDIGARQVQHSAGKGHRPIQPKAEIGAVMAVQQHHAPDQRRDHRIPGIQDRRRTPIVEAAFDPQHHVAQQVDGDVQVAVVSCLCHLGQTSVGVGGMTDQALLPGTQFGIGGKQRAGTKRVQRGKHGQRLAKDEVLPEGIGQPQFGVGSDDRLGRPAAKHQGQSGALRRQAIPGGDQTRPLPTRAWHPLTAVVRADRPRSQHFRSKHLRPRHASRPGTAIWGLLLALATVAARSSTPCEVLRRLGNPLSRGGRTSASPGSADIRGMGKPPSA